MSKPQFFYIYHTVTRYCDQCCKGDTSSQWEKANLPLSPHPHPLTDSHEILHTWLRPPYLPTRHIWSRSPRGYFSPSSQSYHSILFYFFLLCTIFFFISFFFVRKIFPRTYSSGRWTDFDMRYTPSSQSYHSILFYFFLLCTIFFISFFFVRKIFLRTYSSGRWTDFDMRYTSRRVFTQGIAFWG